MSNYVLGDWRRTVVKRIVEMNDEDGGRWRSDSCSTNRSHKDGEIRGRRVPVHSVPI